jgi:hypothetical protein
MAGSDYSAATDAAMAGTDTAAATQVATDTGSPSTATATATAEDSVVEGQQPDLQPPVATSTATAPQPQTFDPKSWGIKYRDKVEYPKDAKHLLTLAQQGFGATQRLAEMNRREAELSQQSQKVQQYLALEEQFSKNPAVQERLKRFIQETLGQQQQGAPQAAQPTAAQGDMAAWPKEAQETIAAMQAKIDQMAQVVPQLQQRFQTADEQAADAGIKAEVDALQKSDAYKGFDWTTDEGEGTLSMRVMKRALELGGVPLETALRDMMWDTNKTRIEAETLARAAEQQKAAHRAGVVQTATPGTAPAKQQPTIGRQTSWRDASKMALSDPIIAQST